MSSSSITVENLYKAYHISHQGKAPDTLRDSLASLFRGGRSASTSETFHALQDVSFQVEQGEVLGIIGHNGAGKSTLLKILSRITEPTSGEVKLQGRVSSLLEVGTGFHPELSGRENIFLNGAILGMSRKEIHAKFDEIVDFAGVEKFLDTPVKRYSSGMYVRLAFAVAAHLEPEIMIVDEVLAVGDIAFQKKCLGKMQSVAQHGRTVLFVSHQLSAIRSLCQRVILLEHGKIKADGSAPAILQQYADTQPQQVQSNTQRDSTVTLLKVTVEDLQGESKHTFAVGERWRVRVRVQIHKPMQDFSCALSFVTSQDVCVQTCWSTTQSYESGIYEVTYIQNSVNLAAESYRIFIGITEAGATVQQAEASRITVVAENALIPCLQYSGAGNVLNSMEVTITKEET